LEECGVALTVLPADLRYPDSTFVEDVAILTKHHAMLTRPGATSRAGEVDEIRTPLSRFYESFDTIESPGTIDGGDVCEAGSRYFIGISGRTNEEGAHQLSRFLSWEGKTSTHVNIRATVGILHLKSGIAYLGNNRLLAIDAFAHHPVFRAYEIVRVAPGEEYAANCILVNGRVIIAAGHPATEEQLRVLGYNLIVLEMSEFRKMDGGLSCLSLRF
jgi:dimethylargininase